jgi:hypothetical protein
MKTGCGCDEHLVTFPPRCIKCGHRSCDVNHPLEIPSTRSIVLRWPLYALIEIFERIHARHMRRYLPELLERWAQDK